MRLLTPSDYLEMPWKDGQGMTTQLHIHPEGATVAGGFGWRLSMARVPGGGPFSRFAGYDRHLLLLKGEGMVLHLEGAMHRLDRPLEPFAFPGETPVRAELIGGPCLDFNLIADRHRYVSDLRVLRTGPAPLALPTAPLRILFASEDALEIGPRRLAPGETLLLSPDEAEFEVQSDRPGAPLILGLLWPR